MTRTMCETRIAMLSEKGAASDLRTLATLLHDCVHDGASIGFVLPFSIDEAETCWADKVLPRLGSGKLTLLTARQDDRLVGSVLLDYDTPPNQPH